MKILLMGEFSNVHATLADALRKKGHYVTVASHGDVWKNYPRDIDLRWNQSSRLSYYWFRVKLIWLALFRFKGYDVVQYINPTALWVKQSVSIWFFNQLKKHNKLMVYGVFGDDYLTVDRMLDTDRLQYSDFVYDGRIINASYNLHRIKDKQRQKPLWECMVRGSTYFIAGAYDCYVVYDSPEYAGRLFYIPFPIKCAESSSRHFDGICPVRILLGIQRKRMLVKGTDMLLPLFRRLEQKYPERIELSIVENIPFEEYNKMLRDADVVVDQLYSVCPAMNALETMKYGAITVSGGEEVFYDFIGEQTLRPIINLRPFDDEGNLKILEDILLTPENLNRMSRESIEFIKKYHDSDIVAEKYLEIWKKGLERVAKL